MKTIQLFLLIPLVIFLQPKFSNAQRSEIGINLIIGGALIFGPYYSYGFDDHNQIEFGIYAGYSEKWSLPFAFNTRYNYYFNDKKWRPLVGAQYTLMTPKTEGENKRKNFHMFSLVPRIQDRFNNYKASVEERLWISTLKIDGKWQIIPFGLETKIGFIP